MSSGNPMVKDCKRTLGDRKASFWERTDYDRAFRGSFGQYMTDVESRALERVLGSERFSLLLDLGCGHGRFLRWLAPRGERLIGLDRSWRLLGVARTDLEQDPLDRPLSLLWASATELPLATDAIDAITCVRVIQHVPDQELALSEARRVLRPGGRL
ncbi:MAG: class I SAM-dependent methyltransferase, partial [Acidobacteriota bacterium]